MRELLIAKRAELTGQISDFDDQADEMLVDRERLEYDEEDGSSLGSDIQRAQIKEMANRWRLEVDEIDIALARVDEGSYGRCDECYERIIKDRLRYQVPVFTCTDCRATV